MVDHPSRPLSVRQFARDLGTTPSTIHRTFANFEEHRLLGRAEDGQYVIRLHLYQICESIAGRLSPTHIAMPRIQRLAEECGGTVSFGDYNARERPMLSSAGVEISHELRLVPQLHGCMPVHCGATGLVILAHLPRAEPEAVYADGLEQVTPATLTSPKRRSRRSWRASAPAPTRSPSVSAWSARSASPAPSSTASTTSAGRSA